MELFSSAWLSALLAIVLIDLVLAGDNAIVIARAARNLPAHLQKKAIVVRTTMTVGVVWLLRVPGLMAIGGRQGVRCPPTAAGQPAEPMAPAAPAHEISRWACPVAVTTGLSAKLALAD